MASGHLSLSRILLIQQLQKRQLKSTPLSRLTDPASRGFCFPVLLRRIKTCYSHIKKICLTLSRWQPLFRWEVCTLCGSTLCGTTGAMAPPVCRMQFCASVGIIQSFGRRVVDVGLGIRAFCSRNFVLFYWFTYLNSTVKLFIPNLPCDGCTLVMTVFAIVFSLSPWDHAMFIADKVCFFCPSGFYYFLQHQVCVSTAQQIRRVPRQKEGHSVDPVWTQRHTNQTKKFKR
jgi:hypothetical protein